MHCSLPREIDPWKPCTHKKLGEHEEGHIKHRVTSLQTDMVFVWNWERKDTNIGMLHSRIKVT